MTPDAETRIVNGEPRPVDPPQDDEMVHIPMQNRWGSQVAQARDFEPQWTSDKAEPGGIVHQSSQRRALQRDGILSAQTIEIGLPPVIGRDHRQASQAAFGCGSLMD